MRWSEKYGKRIRITEPELPLLGAFSILFLAGCAASIAGWLRDHLSLFFGGWLVTLAVLWTAGRFWVGPIEDERERRRQFIWIITGTLAGQLPLKAPSTSHAYLFSGVMAAWALLWLWIAAHMWRFAKPPVEELSII